ncbi:MAG: GNAT family N-acetyltransferase, partial [Lachnospiraceae bacterium]|nr:GNAT family N-acetyltransferase [Lachnospiraceae bacterium]
GFIYHTTVKKEYRGQGIGKKLVDSAMKALEAEGIHKVALAAFEKNVSGNAYWENRIASQKELVLERIYMEDKMFYFMNKLIGEDINDFDNERFELEQKYAAMFGHGVPREMFPPSVSEDEIMKAVESCVQNQKDELMKLLDVEE